MTPTGKIGLGTSLALLSGGIAQAAKPATGTTPKKPNIVLVITDDCRFLDLGCYGSPDAITPNIDRLAAEGVRFTRFFQATAMSSATRHCLLTGLYPVRSGAYPNHTRLNDGVGTLPQYLKQAGYRVALEGKRHIAPIEAFPFEYLSNEQQRTVYPELIEPFLADVARSGEPFFLYVGSTEPHDPWNKGDQSLWNPNDLTLPCNLVDTPATRKQFRNYLAEINELDNQVGAVDALLHKYGLDENTIFIFTSEQGYSFPFGKWTCYDEGLHTGFVIRWPGTVKPGRVTDAMCEYVDVTPTLVDIAGGKIPEGLDGRSFLPVIKGETDSFKNEVYGIQTSRGIFFGPEYYAIRSIRNERYAYIMNLTPEATFKCMSTNPKKGWWMSWKEKAATDEFARRQVERYQKRPAEELYDIVNDPFQTRNLADDPQYAGEKARMRAKLLQWMESQGDKGQQTEMEALEHMVKHR
ncbi:sulfatase [Alistipes senegalensis]|uniref:sulfatase family protein n=1 Tax=Alistipes senegalensis TaxID=1288121 RepID=UPI0026703A91|nr:sulfatase [Alistipes senegalensis]